MQCGISFELMATFGHLVEDGILTTHVYACVRPVECSLLVPFKLSCANQTVTRVTQLAESLMPI